MKKKDVVAYFGTQKSSAESLGISQVAVCKWGEVIPEACALRLERITNGALSYDESLYRTINDDVA